jgi:hypothetical protein
MTMASASELVSASSSASSKLLHIMHAAVAARMIRQFSDDF